MEETIRNRLKHAWNAFINNGNKDYRHYGYGSSTKPDRMRFTVDNEQSIVSALYNRIAMDVASIEIKHVRLDHDGRYLETIPSNLNECLTLSPNLDQTGRAFMQDVVMSLFDDGVVAIVPTEATLNPNVSGSYDILSMRVGEILEWYPEDVRVRVYNERTGQKEELTLSKKIVAIVENPFYAVMNEPNGVLQRLIRKLNILDAIDEQSGSGKLDMIIQLPYTIKTEAMQKKADARREKIEEQLKTSKYGIAYADGTEKVVQLNRPAENNLMEQIKYLTSMLHSQLGITDKVFDGTADEQTMLNYNNRSLEPVISAIVDSEKRTFLTKTARTQKQSIMIFRNPFKLVPVNDLADIADKFTRNEILSSNELRAIVGYKPAKDEGADELRNKNLNIKEERPTPKVKTNKEEENNEV